MMLRRLTILVGVLALTACSSSHRPVYSGHQESTEGVPGFADGKKLSPYVKLGQSYSVDGEMHVPRHQPDYVEEGMASWYGPGFHGGKTANGEEFDSNALTGAHRTLPLPSIVRVTMLSTGKSAYVRINDRGPFAHSRIIDLSRGAAEKIGLIRAGVAKVRVEYMPQESERFAALLSEGRDPTSIDMEAEVLNQPNAQPTQYAASSKPMPAKSRNASFWDSVIPSAEAAEPARTTAQDTATYSSAPVADVDAGNDDGSPFAVAQDESDDGGINEAPLDTSPEPSPVAAMPPQRVPPSNAPPPTTGGTYVQLGAFQNQDNADRLKQQFPGAFIVKKTNSSGATLNHVRVGPFANESATTAIREQAHARGIEAKIVRE